MGEHPVVKWLAVAGTVAGLFMFLWSILAAESEQEAIAARNLIIQEEWRADEQTWNTTQIRLYREVLTEQKLSRQAMRRLEADHVRIDAMLIEHLGAEAHTSPGKHP